MTRLYWKKDAQGNIEFGALSLWQKTCQLLKGIF